MTVRVGAHTHTIVYKPTKSASSTCIKPMKLAKHKFTPFQAIKLTCASESEAQTLKATVSQHQEDSNMQSFFQCHAEKFDFLPTESPFVVLHVDAYI